MNKLSTKRAVLFFNGNLSDVRRVKSYLRPTDFIICADGAADICLQYNIVPHVILGDFDSLSKLSQLKLRKNSSKWIRFPREKDETDSELAITYALDNHYKDLLIFGLLGSRLDHVLNNIFALEVLAVKGIHALCVEGTQEMQVITKSLMLKGKIGELISLIPLKGDVKRVTTKGLKYPLVKEDLPFGFSRGISNIFLGNNAEIVIEAGSLLVIHHKKS